MENNIKPPSGFEPVTVSDNYWVVKEPGAIIHGVLLSRHARKKGTGNYYSVRLEQPCKVVTGSGDAREVVSMPPGTIVNLDEHSAIAGMRELLTSELQYSIWVRYIELMTLPNGGHYWKTEFFKRGLPPADDSIPF